MKELALIVAVGSIVAVAAFGLYSMNEHLENRNLNCLKKGGQMITINDSRVCAKVEIV